MSLLDAFLWLGQTPLGLFLNGSTFFFALTESAHLLGIALLGGAVVATDLAAVGVLFRKTPPLAIARGAGTVFWAALLLMVISGVALVAAGPFKYYSNPLFPVKLGLLAVALVLQLSLLIALKRAPDAPNLTARLLAIASLALWLTVLVVGRWLGLI
jgi:hypothetical protein